MQGMLGFLGDVGAVDGAIEIPGASTEGAVHQVV
jgi:hypothetical protein